jgi:hypothetical protein
MTALEDVRDWVGDTPDDTAVNAQLTRFADDEHPTERAALAILLRRQADGGPAKWGVAGDYNEDDTTGRNDLAGRIARLRAIVGDDVSTLPPLTSAPLAGPGNLR